MELLSVATSGSALSKQGEESVLESLSASSSLQVAPILPTDSSDFQVSAKRARGEYTFIGEVSY